MASIQMMPSAGATNPMTVNGRAYNCPVNGVLMVPDFDANVLEANGWLKTAAHGSSPTVARPITGLFKGMEIFDTTLNINIKWDGKVWRSSVTGAAV
jgi:hypothetical protein